MILTDEMLAAAFQCRKLALWDLLSDGDVFAFRLSDGETGYCCLMGQGGEHYAVGFYRGQKGFSTYLKTIELAEQQLSPVEMCELIYTFDCINCDFSSASIMVDGVKKIIRRFADAHGLKIQRPNGWPDFVRHQPGAGQRCITSEADARDIVEALNAVCALGKMLEEKNPVELGFDEKGNYPTIKGGKTVPYLVPDKEGTYNLQTTRLPALQPDIYFEPKFVNDLQVFALKKLSASDTLQMKFLHMPVSEDSEEIPLVLICRSIDNEMFFPIFVQGHLDDNQEKLLSALADALIDSDSRPHAIEVEDAQTEALLKHFCSRCGIRLLRMKKLPELNDACCFMLGSMMM